MVNYSDSFTSYIHDKAIFTFSICPHSFIKGLSRRERTRLTSTIGTGKNAFCDVGLH